MARPAPRVLLSRRHERRGHRLVRVVACGGARANRTREAQAATRPRRLRRVS